ncbi:hypothetical protein ACJX0J_018887, partial [Zea mays]
FGSSMSYYRKIVSNIDLAKNNVDIFCFTFYSQKKKENENKNFCIIHNFDMFNFSLLQGFS